MGEMYSYLRLTGQAGNLRLHEQFITAGLDVSFLSRFSLSFNLGALAGGSVLLPDANVHFTTGGSFGIGFAYRLLESKGLIPFVLVQASVSGLWAGTERGSYNAFDFRAGALVGYPFSSRVSGYVHARAFGGPVTTTFGTGADLYHYQIGGGLIARIGDRMTFSCEGNFVGERGLTCRIGVQLTR